VFSLRIHLECGWPKKWVEIRSCSLWAFKLIFFNPSGSLSSFHHWRAALSPRVDHIGPNWVTILMCLFSFLFSYIYWFDYACGAVIHLDIGLFVVIVVWGYFIYWLLHPLLHAFCFIGVILSEFTTLRMVLRYCSQIKCPP
jgi:hypothetical protein